MEKYEILLNEIKEHLNKEEINYNTNNEIISAYDLYNIINEELEGLRNIKLNSKLNKKLNSFFFLNSSMDFYIKLIGFEKNCTLCIEESTYDEPFTEYIHIHKDKGINEIYIRENENCFNKKIFRFIKKNYNLILETLQTLEDYVGILGDSDNSYYKNIELEDSLFKIELEIKNNGITNYKISILDSHELYEEYNKNWYKREGIYEFANNNAEEILKRMPVSPYELEEPFKSIYYKHKEKQNNKTKTLKMHQ